VRHGHGVSLLLEDDVRLSGPRPPSPQERALGLAPWPEPGPNHTQSSPFAAGLRALFDELGEAARRTARATGGESRGGIGGIGGLFGAAAEAAEAAVPVAADPGFDPGFDVVVVGECVFAHWRDKHRGTAQRSPHLFQVGGSKRHAKPFVFLTFESQLYPPPLRLS
jgi:hypothetical protein